MEFVIIGIGAAVFLAHLFSALFEKTRIPDVLPLVCLGLLLGPILGLVRPADLGRVGAAFTTLALVIILFEGGLNLKLKVLRDSVASGTRLTLVNFIVTVLAAAPLGAALLGLSWIESLLLGAIIGGTSSAVVIPMISKLPLEEPSRAALLLESAFSDVLCIVVALALLQSAETRELRAGLVAGRILSSFTLAFLTGAAGAVFWSLMLQRVRRLENSLFTTPAFVCVVFGTAELLGFSGAIASLVFGVTLGNIDLLENSRLPPARWIRLKPRELNEAERALLADVVFLLKTFFFIYIGVSLKFSRWGPALAGLLLTAAAFVARVPVVRWSLPKSFPRSDAAVSAVMVPKGLAAAVLASLPLQAGLARGRLIEDAVYSVVFFSIVMTTLLVFLLEQGFLARLYEPWLACFAAAPAPETRAPKLL